MMGGDGFGKGGKVRMVKMMADGFLFLGWYFEDIKGILA
jgi:hypothetical protein